MNSKLSNEDIKRRRRARLAGPVRPKSYDEFDARNVAYKAEWLDADEVRRAEIEAEFIDVNFGQLRQEARRWAPLHHGESITPDRAINTYDDYLNEAAYFAVKAFRTWDPELGPWTNWCALSLRGIWGRVWQTEHRRMRSTAFQVRGEVLKLAADGMDAEHIAEGLELDIEDVNEMLHPAGTVGLDEPGPLNKSIADTTESNDTDVEDNVLLRMQFDDLADHLSRQLFRTKANGDQIISSYLNHLTGTRTLKEIGEEVGLSREAARCLMNRVEAAILHPVSMAKWPDFAGLVVERNTKGGKQKS